ncbi:hypothetical protein [Anabaena sp. UHCC 0451]|uniref:hypothetical protein n=1 Tax=Anabaena sp. UHCC 0451 TaxID=2055235 RepID=UPI002B21618B|nr:hypothetical protein [Anabaena sp. UHCC 0451]MEA5579024.1 hypothetical protein [Anabaena sp. UHCC 0451]
MAVKNLEKQSPKNLLLNEFSRYRKGSSDDSYIQYFQKYQEPKWLTENSQRSDKFSKISKFYTIKNILDVNRFLQDHSNLIDVLVEAHPQIRKYFPTEKLRLKLYVDPESPEWDKLVLYICASPESVDQALNQLDELDENWWIDASLGVAVNLCIHLDFE